MSKLKAARAELKGYEQQLATRQVELNVDLIERMHWRIVQLSRRRRRRIKRQFGAAAQ